MCSIDRVLQAMRGLHGVELVRSAERNSTKEKPSMMAQRLSETCALLEYRQVQWAIRCYVDGGMWTKLQQICILYSLVSSLVLLKLSHPLDADLLHFYFLV